MTFADRLEELLKVPGRWEVRSDNPEQVFVPFLASHAGAILELVRAAERHLCAAGAPECKMCAAFAKLNGEQT